MIAKIKHSAGILTRDACALYFACRHPLTPWYARVWAALVAGYAFSPVDIIPDFIPVLGYLDDLLIVPVGVWLGIKMIPAAVMLECRQRADAELAGRKPVTRGFAVVVAAVWLLVLYLVVSHLMK